MKIAKLLSYSIAELANCMRLGNETSADNKVLFFTSCALYLMIIMPGGHHSIYTREFQKLT